METELIILAAVLMTAGFYPALSPVCCWWQYDFGAGAVSNLHLFRPGSAFTNPYGGCQFMAIICFTGSLSARSHFKRGAVDMEVVKSWGAFIAIGALAGAVAARFIAPAGQKITFAALALSMATRMLLNDNPGEAGEARIGATLQKALSCLVGVSLDGHWRRHIRAAIECIGA